MALGMDARRVTRKTSVGGLYASAAKGLNVRAENEKALVNEFIAWQSALHLGDLASIAGLLLSIVGFAITIAGVLSSRRAAQRAEAAAKAAVFRVRLFDELMNLTAAITILDEIRRFHRLRQWTLLPDRYTTLRRTLILVRSSNLPLTEEQSSALHAALATLQSVERTVEEGMSNPARLDGAKLNTLLAPHLDDLLVVLSGLKAHFTDRRNGKD